MMAKPPEHLRRRQIIDPPGSRNGPPPKPSKPRFSPSERPTSPRRNDNVSRWAAIAEVLPGLDGQARAILDVVATALADMAPTEPTPVIQLYDRMNERQRRVLAAVVLTLAASE